MADSLTVLIPFWDFWTEWPQNDIERYKVKSIPYIYY